MTSSEKGEMNGNLAGRYSSISRQAALLCRDQSCPVVTIETMSNRIVIKDYDTMTIALKCSRTED
jgi:hypothetical protein